MDNKPYVLAITIVVAILIGVGFILNQTRDPILREILTNQALILDKVNALETKDVVSAGPSDLGPQMAALEKKIDGLETIFKNLGNAPRPTPPSRPTIDPNQVHDIPVAHTTIIGKKDAPVTITEFMDYQCPFCARFHPDVAKILKEYPDQVNLLVKNFPLSFHQQARPASKAALAAAEQGKFAEMVAKLIESSRALSPETIQSIAKEIGLNMKKFNKDLTERDSEWEEMIKKDMQLGAQVGVRGTPSFYINGRVTNARTFDAWKAEVEKELEKVK